MTSELPLIVASTASAIAVVRCVNVYLARERDRAVVAATSKTISGIYYEQPFGAVLLSTWPTPETLGSAFRTAFDLFCVKEADLQQHKKSSWPAFLASKVRSVGEFEQSFVSISCVGLNTANVIVRASCGHPKVTGVELSVAFNPLLPAEVGVQLQSLFNAASAA